MGELTPPQSYMSLRSSGNYYGAAVGVNNVVGIVVKTVRNGRIFYSHSQEVKRGVRIKII